MSARIAECRGIGEAAAADCVETTEIVPAAVRCTVTTTDVCSLTTGDAVVNAKEPKKEPDEKSADDGCCCDC